MPAAVCILAGGLSHRMGRDKSRLRLGSRTLLGHVRAQAFELGLPVRIIRRDLVPRCGPLGGIYTGLKTSRAEAELFLACDMPFVPVAVLRKLLASWRSDRRATFTVSARRPGSAPPRTIPTLGFPCLIPLRELATVRRQVAAGRFSMHDLARALKAARLYPSRGQKLNLINVNTPAEWRAVQLRWKISRAQKDFARAACK